MADAAKPLEEEPRVTAMADPARAAGPTGRRVGVGDEAGASGRGLAGSDRSASRFFFNWRKIASSPCERMGHMLGQKERVAGQLGLIEIWSPPRRHQENLMPSPI